jgi:mevalonate kinase
MTSRASACGKIILLGEHAVVYGYPAVALPVRSLRTWAELSEGPSPLRIRAPAVHLDAELADLPAGHPIAFCVRHAAQALDVKPPTGLLTITSDIPVASGLGSGAAVSTAVVRAMALAVRRELSPAEVSAIVFAVEHIYHGTPSGVDNTVIAYEQPIFFRRRQEPEILAIRTAMHILIADSGMPGKTRDAVADVRARWKADPARYEEFFREIGGLVEAGRRHLEAGQTAELGNTMDQCHELLRTIEVATPALDRLVEAARQAGARGAKLSGAGLGGNVVALVDARLLPEVESALLAAGAARVYRTHLEP